jgi:hypothetical protein
MGIPKVVLAAATLAFSLPALAVDFGVMESADPVRKGDFKFEGYPLAARRSDTQDQQTGANVAFGYGMGQNWDAEVQLANYDDVLFFGVDAEYSFIDEDRYEVSLDGGAHYGNHDLGTQRGLDLTPLVSYRPRSLHGFKWNAALDLAYDWIDLAVSSAQDASYLSAYVVPGAQYRIAHEVDLIGEIGVGLNNDSSDYASAGLAVYFR